MSGICPITIDSHAAQCDSDDIALAIHLYESSHAINSGEAVDIDCLSLLDRDSLTSSGQFVEAITGLYRDKEICTGYDDKLSNLVGLGNDRKDQDGLESERLYTAGLFADACGRAEKARALMLEAALLGYEPAYLEIDRLSAHSDVEDHR